MWFIFYKLPNLYTLYTFLDKIYDTEKNFSDFKSRFGHVKTLSAYFR